MTVASTVSSVTYTGDGSNTSFAFSFIIPTSSDIVVEVTNTTTGTITAIAAGSSATTYSVSGIGAGAGGTVTYPASGGTPLAATEKITIRRVVAATQSRDFTDGAALYADEVEGGLDRLTYVTQGLGEQMGRALKLGPAVSGVDPTLPTPTATQVIRWNDAGDGLENWASTTDISAVAAVVGDINTLGPIAANITTVAGISANVTTVAGISANVSSLAPASADVTTLAPRAADIGTLADVQDGTTATGALSTLAPISANIATVAGISGNVTTVAGIAANVTTVAGISTDVSAVAGVASDVSAVAAQAIGWAFDATTTMADPGAGDLRFNNATLASVTAIAISDTDSNAADQSAYVLTWDDSTNTDKGTLTVRDGTSGAWATFTLTGLTDNAGWTELAVTHVASGGTFSAADSLFVGFSRTGDKGVDGAGAGDVTGPASSTDNALARFDSTTGKLVQNSVVTVDDAGNMSIPGTLTVSSIDGPTGGRVTLTATGTLANGDVVVLNADGTVSVVAGAAEGAGTAAVFESAASDYNSVASIGNDKVVIAYQDGGNASYGTAVVGTVSGTSISFGTPVVFESANSAYISVASIGGDKVVIGYRDGGNALYGTAIVGTVSGTSISFGTSVVFESASTSYISVASIGADKVVIAYQDVGNTDFGTAVVGTVSGTSISFGTPVVFESANSDFISVASIGNDKVVIGYRDGGNANYGTAIVGTVSGTSISFGTPVVFESANSSYISVASIGADKVVIGYQDGGNASYGTAVVGTVSGTSISFGTPVIFESANSGFISAASIGNDKVVIGYRDGGNTNFGTGIVYQSAYTNAPDWIGISESAVTDASATIATLGAVVTNQTGLTTNTTYYVADNGDLTTTVTAGRKIGKALSATSLLIEGDA